MQSLGRLPLQQVPEIKAERRTTSRSPPSPRKVLPTLQRPYRGTRCAVSQLKRRNCVHCHFSGWLCPYRFLSVLNSFLDAHPKFVPVFCSTLNKWDKSVLDLVPFFFLPWLCRLYPPPFSLCPPPSPRHPPQAWGGTSDHQISGQQRSSRPCATFTCGRITGPSHPRHLLLRAAWMSKQISVRIKAKNLNQLIS